MLSEIKTVSSCILYSRQIYLRAIMVFVSGVCICLAPADCLAVPMTDQQITNAVDHMFLVDPELRDNQINTEVGFGIVTLSGATNNLMAKERAAALAETVSGVRGVVNTIVVKPTPRADDEIARDVKLALLYDPATKSYKFEPAVKDGVVTLGGTAQSYREKRSS